MSEQEFPSEETAAGASAGEQGAAARPRGAAAGARPSVKARGVAAGKARQRSAGSNRVETSARRPTASSEATGFKPVSVSTSRRDRPAAGRGTRTERSAGAARASQGGVRHEISGIGAERNPFTAPASPADASDSPLSRILAALRTAAGAVGGAFLSAAQVLAGRVPALGRFGTRAIAAALGVLALILIVLLVSFVRGCSSPHAAEAPEQDQQPAEQAEPQVETVGTGVNPDQPVSLAWRDSEFAVDPSKTTWTNKDNGRKVVYLTIDDGPSELTEQFLDLLDEYDVKATFFVTGNNPSYYGMIREAYNRGHTIGLHSMTHDYAKVYASEDAFYEDLEAVGKVVEAQIGYVPCFTRFPGGSSNGVADGYSKDIMGKLVEGVQQRGYQYYDWSLSSGDGENRTAQELVSQSTSFDGGEGAADPTKDTNIILLCHDSATKQSTLEALPKIIEYYQSQGYSFEAIDRKTWACHHAVWVDDEADKSDEAAQDADQDAQQAEAEDAYAQQDGYAETEYAEEDYAYEEPAEYAEQAEEAYYDEGYSEDEGASDYA